MVNTSNCPIFFCFRTNYYKFAQQFLFLFQVERGKIKMACLTAKVDTNLNQCMVNSLLTNLGKNNNKNQGYL